MFCFLSLCLNSGSLYIHYDSRTKAFFLSTNFVNTARDSFRIVKHGEFQRPCETKAYPMFILYECISLTHSSRCIALAGSRKGQRTVQ